MTKETRAVWLYRAGVCVSAVAELMLWPGMFVDDLGIRLKDRAVRIMCPPRPMTGLWDTLTSEQQGRILELADDV